MCTCVRVSVCDCECARACDWMLVSVCTNTSIKLHFGCEVFDFQISPQTKKLIYPYVINVLNLKCQKSDHH